MVLKLPILPRTKRSYVGLRSSSSPLPRHLATGRSRFHDKSARCHRQTPRVAACSRCPLELNFVRPFVVWVTTPCRHPTGVSHQPLEQSDITKFNRREPLGGLHFYATFSAAELVEYTTFEFPSGASSWCPVFQTDDGSGRGSGRQARALAGFHGQFPALTVPLPQ